jgi:acetyl esterase
MTKIYIDPAMAAILERGRADPAPDYTKLPLAEGRATFERFAAGWNQDPPVIAERLDLTVPTRWGAMAARLYRPSPEHGLPLVIYVHGGGWTFGSIRTHDRAMAHLALEGSFAVLGIDYRLAPDHPYPAAIDDVADTLAALDSGILGERVDTSRLGISGDSAGAGIALGALLDPALRERISAAALFYGCYAPVFDTASHSAFGGGDFQLTTARMRWYWRNWLGALADDSVTPATPARCELAGLPPIYLNAAGLDPLRDETFDLARRLAEAGNDCRIDLFAGVCHGFMQMASRLPAARRAHRAGAEFLAEHLR